MMNRSNLWDGMFINLQYRKDREGIFRPYFVLHINGKEHSQHENQTQAECEFLKSKGLDPLKYRGK